MLSFLSARSALATVVLLVGASAVHAQFDARVQAIHNAPDPELAVIDLYVADMLVLDDVAFRTASPYLDIPGILPLTGGIAPGNSTGPEDVFFEFSFTLTPFQTYQFILTGVRNPGDFLPNPDGRDISLDVLVNEDAREVASDPSSVDVSVVHGVTDVSMTDVTWTKLLADDILFGQFSGYTTVAPTGGTPVIVSPSAPETQGFEAPLYDPGDAITLLLSGFDDPSGNQNGPLYIVVAVYPDGRSIPLIPITVANEGRGARPTSFTLHGNYPNPFNPTTTITFDLESPAEIDVDVFDLYGRQVLLVDGGVFSAGSRHEIQLDASPLSSGSYVYRVRADVNGALHSQSGRMILLK